MAYIVLMQGRPKATQNALQKSSGVIKISKLGNDNDNDVYFTLATSDSRIGKYKMENN